MSTSATLSICLSLPRADFTLDVDLHLPAQGVTVIFGPSGSGKTSLLRCVAGLERAFGSVVLAGAVWQDNARDIFKPTWQREIGYVFQEASLFEHLDVERNLTFGLQRVDRNATAQALAPIVELLGISHLLTRRIASLSGGERQRVAIARALVTRPKILLLDEPLASIDLARRSEVLPWLERLHEDLRIPVLYVTHSVDELARLADHVVLLEKGRVVSSASLSDAMASRQLASALGEEAGVILDGKVVACDTLQNLTQIRVGSHHLWAPDSGIAIGNSIRLRILARDVSLTLSSHDDTTIQNRLAGVIVSIEPDVHPAQTLVGVRCDDLVILCRVTRRALTGLKLDVGASVWCQVKSVALIV